MILRRCTKWSPRIKYFHPWFAWIPVWVGDELVWLRYVERKMLDCGAFMYRPFDLDNYP